MSAVIGISPHPRRKDRPNEVFHILDYGTAEDAMRAARRAYPRKKTFYEVRAAPHTAVREYVAAKLSEYPGTAPEDLTSNIQALEKAERMVLSAIPHAKLAVKGKFVRLMAQEETEDAVTALEGAAAALNRAIALERKARA